MKNIFFDIFQLVLILCLMGNILAIYFFVKKKKGEGYDYDAENPNALVSGKSIAGTVYASYPENTGGLGWIL
jgi:hypothetical protein